MLQKHRYFHQKRDTVQSNLIFTPLCCVLSGEATDTNFVMTHDLRTQGKQAYHYTIRLLTKSLVETELPGESGGNSGSLISRDDIVNVLCYY